MMLRFILLAGALTISGCDNAGDGRICLTPPVEIVPGDVDACVHKWAYRLARSNETASIVAKATVMACDDVAEYQAEQIATSPAIMAAGDPEKVRSTQLARLMEHAEAEALFRVVQARAGACQI